jgi:hypothetical protein
VGWRAWGAAAAIAAAGSLPFVVWRLAHHVSNADIYPLSHSLDPSFLAHNGHRLTTSIARTAQALASQSSWIWLVPLFLALALVCAAKGVARRQATFYIGTLMLMMASAWWVYWTGKLDIRAWLDMSVDRVATGPALVCAVGLMHLSWLVLRPAILRSSPP